MNIILDLALVAIMVLSIVISAKKGFFKTLLSGSAFVIALLLTVALVAPVRNMLAQSVIYDTTKDSISAWISDTVMNSLPDGDITAEQLREYTVEHEDLCELINSLGMDTKVLTDGMGQNYKDGVKTAVDRFADDVAAKVAMAAVGLIAAVVLFLILFIGVKLLAKFMSAVIKKIPVLRTADGLLGAVLGLVFGILRIFAFVSVMHLMIPVMQTSQSAFISGVVPADTLIFGFFYNINLFAFLI